jgi:hypothetical protein
MKQLSAAIASHIVSVVVPNMYAFNFRKRKQLQLSHGSRLMLLFDVFRAILKLRSYKNE